jgi:hypothetical protein
MQIAHRRSRTVIATHSNHTGEFTMDDRRQPAGQQAAQRAGQQPTRTLRNALISGSAASAASALALAACSSKEARSPFSAVNAVSHWLWGDQAFGKDRPSWRYTALGMAIHHASAVFWGALFERVFHRKLDQSGPGTALATAAATTAVACFADYRLTPRRLEPGYEQRLSTASLTAVYVAFALGLAAGALAAHRR